MKSCENSIKNEESLLRRSFREVEKLVCDIKYMIAKKRKKRYNNLK